MLIRYSRSNFTFLSTAIHAFSLHPTWPIQGIYGVFQETQLEQKWRKEGVERVVTVGFKTDRSYDNMSGSASCRGFEAVVFYGSSTNDYSMLGFSVQRCKFCSEKYRNSTYVLSSSSRVPSHLLIELWSERLLLGNRYDC